MKHEAIYWQEKSKAYASYAIAALRTDDIELAKHWQWRAALSAETARQLMFLE